MDQVKIGRFIAECRKRADLTQMQLAEKLNITDRAVSKWETGKSLPDSSIMLELCRILEITVNDLLSGEVIMMENHDKEMENKLIEMLRAKEESDRRMLAFEWVIGILSVILLLIPSCIACLFPMKEWQQILVVLSGLIPALIGFCFAMKIEQIAGYYECRHCKHKYVPEYMATFPAPHIGRTRFMKCPKCGKRSWQKKVVGKD